MAQNGWRLLAVFSLLLTTLAPLRGQDSAKQRNFAPHPGLLRASPRLMEPADDSFWPRVPAQPPSVRGIGSLAQMAGAAGVIFSGRVAAIGRAFSPASQATASTSITFQVDRALRGTFPGEVLTIREWSGLWTGKERYRVGERVLLFLYPPSKLGLTSPVGGATGKFSLDAQGRILLNDQHTATFFADPILGGKTVIGYGDFAKAVRSSSGQE